MTSGNGEKKTFQDKEELSPSPLDPPRRICL